MSKDSYDVAVLGAGAGGMAAAVFAALQGARVILIERTEYLGGTSALSAASAWIPNTRLADALGTGDSIEKAERYLDLAVGNRSAKALRRVFLEAGPKAVHTLLDKTDVQFQARAFHPDYLSEIDGSATAGRAIEPKPFDARILGNDINLIRPPIPEFTILGGLMVDRDDIAHLLTATKSLNSFIYASKLVGRFLYDKWIFGRARRLVMGNALIARLLLSLRKLGVEIRTRCQVTAITLHGTGAKLTLADGEMLVIDKGVILATGGFGRHPDLRRELLPKPTPEHSPAAPGHTGELNDVIRKLGGHYGSTNERHVFMAPVSKQQRADGSWAIFPHFVFDRSKPRVIAVDGAGKRFVNEARSYHEFAEAQFAQNAIPAHLITDSAGIKKYGLGMVRPGGGGMARLVRNGYLITAPTIADLAKKLGVDAGALTTTIESFNEDVKSGKDKFFHRGETIYERANGDPATTPNPTLGPLDTPPFYSVKLYPTDIGACTGFVTNEAAQLINQSGEPIGPFYACGNDMQSIMGDVYPGPGITIGPAITFAYVAVAHMLADQASEARAKA